MVLSTSCFANFKPLKLLQCIICLSVLLHSDWAGALEVFYLFSELSETLRLGVEGVEGAGGSGVSDFIKGKAVNACIACSDPPQPLCLPGSLNCSIQIHLCSEKRRNCDGRRAIVLLHKAEERRQI